VYIVIQITLLSNFANINLKTITNMSELKEFVKKLAEKHGKKRESLIPILQDLVEENRYLSDEAMVNVAHELDISAADVYGTASFYSFLDTQIRGKYIIRVCKTISCTMKGKIEVLQTIQDVLKLKVGETSSDRKFTLLEANCIGWCHKAPAMLINDTPYTELTSEK
jgi:NADH-quinone oxidoreductase subunit E